MSANYAPVTEPDTGQFDAFLSYSHDDSALAERLSRRLRRYRPPRALRLPRRGLRVFRDVERLTAGSDLNSALVERLRRSTKLVLLCSPAAAASEYVDQEIRAFVAARGSADDVIVVLGDGEVQDGLPPSLRDGPEPLFVNLRETTGSIAGWRRFRRESLRVVAAILGVDYADLRREDEVRAVRQRGAAAVTAVLTTLVAAGVWLANSVPAEAWVAVPLPETYFDTSRLMPVAEWAVNDDDPSLHLYHVYGAEHARLAPELPISVYGGGLNSPTAFLEEARTHLNAVAGQDAPYEPLAVLRFSVSDRSPFDAPPATGDDYIGAGTMRIFGFLDQADGQVRFYRDLAYATTRTDGDETAVALPATAVLNLDDPLSWDPWPTRELIDLNLLPHWGQVVGELRIRWRDAPEPVHYEIQDVEEAFIEADDGQWARDAILASHDDKEVALGGTLMPMSDIDGDWSALLPSDGWRTFHGRRPAPAPGLDVVWNRDTRALGVVVDTSVDERLTTLPETLDPLIAELRGDEDTLTHLSGEGFGERIDLVTFRSIVFDDILGEAASLEVIRVVRRGAFPWGRLQIPFANIETLVLDIVPLDSTAQRFLVVSDQEGVFETKDGGATWRDFTFGHTALATARSLEVIAAGQGPVIHALVRNHDEADNPRGDNELYRYTTRGWLERLRGGLIDALGGNVP